MTTRNWLSALTLTLALLAPIACSSGDVGSCTDLCEEAQSKDCTIISGDCGAFCDAAFAVEDDSGCGGEREAYQSCLEDGDVCDNRCGSLENDYAACLGAYCISNLDSDECQTLTSSI